MNAQRKVKTWCAFSSKPDLAAWSQLKIKNLTSSTTPELRQEVQTNTHKKHVNSITSCASLSK